MFAHVGRSRCDPLGALIASTSSPLPLPVSGCGSLRRRSGRDAFADLAAPGGFPLLLYPLSHAAEIIVNFMDELPSGRAEVSRGTPSMLISEPSMFGRR
jgi:hypothetical protein